MKDKQAKIGKSTSSMADVVGVLRALFVILKDNAPDPSIDPRQRFLFPRGIDHIKVAITIPGGTLGLELKGPDGTREAVPPRGSPCGADHALVPDLEALTYPDAEQMATAAGEFKLVDCAGAKHPAHQRTDEWKVKQHCAGHPKPGTCHNTGGSLGVELERVIGR